VRSSTSSSDPEIADRSVPMGLWLRPFVLAGLVFCLAVALLEGVLAMRGFKPTVVDSGDRWARERARVDGLGERAFIVIGASRAQLDLDLHSLATRTGMAPVQLAIDGNSYVPVLEDLAADERVRGTVLVEYQDGALRSGFPDDRAVEYVKYWRHLRTHGMSLNFESSESALVKVRQAWMRSYADGAGPWMALSMRVMVPNAVPQYLVTLPDRQREANYSVVPMPGFYFQRVMRNAGIEKPPTAPDFASLNQMLSARIDQLQPLDAPDLGGRASHIAALVHRIEERGGAVIFVMFPRSGLVWSADERRFPRSRYWDRFITLTGAHGVHFEDVPALSAFRCPDGSHLDFRDQAAFTNALIDTMASRGWLTRSH